MWTRLRRPTHGDHAADRQVATPSPHMFSSDRPIEVAIADRLNRSTFADRVAHAIANWRRRDSLVVGLYGAWGVGKTSIVNMVIECLHREPGGPLVVHFNPWEWSGHEQLAKALFLEIEAGLRRSDANTGSLVEKLRQYTTILTGARRTIETLARRVAAAGAVVGTLGLTLGWTGALGWNWGGVLTLAGGAALVLSHFQSVLLALKELIRRDERAPLSLSEAKEQLRAAVAKFGPGILIIVDDVDRLRPDDAVRVLQIVKANADLPGIVFLIAMDRRSVAESVHAALAVDGNSYLEKIVQVGFDVPVPNPVDLGSLLVDGVKSAVDSLPPAAAFSAARWRDLYVNVLLEVVETPRQAIRFVSMLTFGLQGYANGPAYEVDPVDYIAIEALRQFAPDVYDLVRMSKRLLTGSTDGDNANQQVAQRAVAPIDAAVESSVHSTPLRWLMERTFPAFMWATGGAGTSFDRMSALRDRRVFHEDMFDRYFQLVVPRNDVSNAEVASIAALAGHDQNRFIDAMQVIIQSGRAMTFLFRIRANLAWIAVPQRHMFIAGLFDVGDYLGALNGFGVSEMLAAEFLTEDLLDSEPESSRMQTLRFAWDASTGLALPASLIGLELGRHDQDREPVVPRAPLEELDREIAQRIAELASSNTLLNHSHLAILLYSWTRNDATAAAEWVEGVAALPSGLARLIAAFEGYGRADGPHALASFVNVSQARSRAASWVSDPAVPAEEREAFENWLKDLQRRNELHGNL